MLNNKDLYFVTPDNDDFCKIKSLCEAAIEGGVDIIQLRYKQENIRNFLDLAKELAVLCQKSHIPFIVNDRIDIALAVGADGVHLGQSDIPISYARKILGEKAIIGLSIEEIEQIKHPDIDYADYLAASPVFHTVTKKDIKQPLGLEGLAYMAGYTTKPIVAIGGIEKEHIRAVMEKATQMIAVVSAISESPNPKEATQSLKEEIKKWKSKDLTQF